MVAFKLTPEEKGLLFERAARNSVVKTLGQEVTMGFGGASVTLLPGEVDAQFVGVREKKPNTDLSDEQITLVPRTIATIVTVSEQQLRDISGIMDVIIKKGADAFAKRLDEAVLYGIRSPFDGSVAATTKSVVLDPASVYSSVVNGLGEVQDDDKDVSAFAFDKKAERIFLGAVDNTGRPLFNATPAEQSVLSSGILLGRDALLGKGVGSATVAGFAGDFNNVLWGQAGDVNIKIADQATVGTKSMLEHNMIAVRIETEYAAAVVDPDSFVKFTYYGAEDGGLG